MKSWQTKSGYTIYWLLAGRSNVLLLSNGRQNILIDSSPAIFRKKLNRRLKTLNINRIDYLILTHTHFDHAGNAAYIKASYGAKVIVHASEAEFLETGYSPLPSGTIFFTKALIGLSRKKKSPIGRYEPCTVDILVDDKFSLSEMGLNAYLLHTPGHSTGSMSLVVDDEIAAVGDAMIGRFRNSVFPPFADDIPELIRSWKKLLDTGCSLFIPSHGSPNSKELVLKDYEKRSK
jgi:hydroxyacylglutathione hydrolase